MSKFSFNIFSNIKQQQFRKLDVDRFFVIRPILIQKSLRFHLILILVIIRD